MKRILSILLILILSLGVLSACKPKQPTESEYDLGAAVDYVRSLYTDLDTTKVDFSVVSLVNFYGVKFTVEWSVDNEAIKLEPSEDGLEVTVKVPSNPTEDINYKLTGKVTTPDNFSENVVFDLVVPAPKADPVLDLIGSSNLISKSEDAIVYSANGVTFTINKGEYNSTTTPFTNGVQETYAQRAYAKTTLKVAYNGMRKIVITCDDYEGNGQKYYTGMDGMTVDGAVIVRKDAVISIYFPNGPVNEFLTTPIASQLRIEKIEVFTSLTAEDQAAISGAGNQGGTTETYEAPVEGTAYKLYLYQVDADGIYYFKAGALDKGQFLPTTTIFDQATDIFFEVVDGGYHIYYMDGENKTYINAEGYKKSSGYLGAKFVVGTEPNCVWTYNETFGIFEVELASDEVTQGTNPDTFFAGTYTQDGMAPFTTVSLSGSYYKDQITTGTQYPARISASANGAVSKPTTNPDQGGDQPTTPNYTAPETGKAYKFYLEQKLQNKNFYFNGGSESYGGGFIFQTSESSDDAVEIFFETNGNGYNIYFYDANNVKTYFDVAPYSGGTPFKCQFKLSTEVPSTVWTFDTTYGVIKASVTFEGNTAEFYAGNYDSGTTIRLSNYSYVGQLLDTTKNQYAARIVPADGTIVNPEQPNPEQPNPEQPGETTGALTSLKTGDVVYIVAPAYNMAMSSTLVSTYYQVAVDVTNGFSGLTDAEKWTVTKNDDGSYTFTSLTNYRLSQSEGYNSFNSTTENYKWTLEEVSTGVFKIKNADTAGYIEYYATKGNWSIYTNPNDAQYEIAFYSVDGTVTPPSTDDGDDNEGSGTTPPAGDEDGNEEGVMTHAEYLAVAKGGSVCIKGYVSYISGNNTFLVDAEGNGYYLYGSAVDATVGEEIIVTGTQDIFNNLYEVKSFTYEKTGNTTTVAPVDYTETLAANGFNVTKELQNKLVVFTGTLTASKTVTVGGKTVALYYKGSVNEPAVGAEVTVIGVLSVYNSNSQVLVWNQDGLKVAEHTCEGQYPCSSTCKICNQAVTAADHTYEDGFCVCGQPQPSAGQTTVTVSIADYATANNWANGVAYNTLTMDDNITVTANKTTGNNSNTGKYYNNGTNWRMYQNEAPEIKVTAAEGKTIVSIKITYSNANTGILTSNGQNITSGTIVTVNANSITFSVGNTNSSTTNGNIQITNIEVIYQ